MKNFQPTIVRDYWCCRSYC